VAREHALTRVNLGFDIGQLVHEFIVLRQMIFLVAREEGLPLDSRIYGVIADLIEGAIATAVQSYADSRDFQARREQAEHIAFLTHELRNPLTTARYGAAQLRRQLGPEHQETMAALDRGHQRLEELIDKVLLSGRLEVEKVKASPVDVLLGKLMEEAISGARGVAREKGLNLAVRYDPKAMVHADPELTRSALQNLVDNAVKYTDHGEVDVRQEDRPGEVVVHVRDNCDGISPEELKVIFEPFRRGVDHDAAGSRKGVGLGLYIVSHLVRQHGGTIAVQSSAETGTHFTLTLPQAAPSLPSILRVGASSNAPHEVC